MRVAAPVARGRADAGRRLGAFCRARPQSAGHARRLLHRAAQLAERPVGAAAEGLAADPHRLRAGGRFPRQCLEHRRRGAAHHGGDRRDRRRPVLSGPGERAAVAADAARRHGGRHGLGGDPGLPALAHEHQRDPGHADADLCRVAVPVLAGAWAVARPGRLQLSADRDAAGSRAVRAVRLRLPASIIRSSSPPSW